MIEVPVLIVGGGPVGLTASIWLSRHGIRSLLVERHPGTAIMPKARVSAVLSFPPETAVLARWVTRVVEGAAASGRG